MNLNDGTVAGRFASIRKLPVFGVQYHPEAGAGCHDSRHLFQRFVDRIRARRAAG